MPFHRLVWKLPWWRYRRPRDFWGVGAVLMTAILAVNALSAHLAVSLLAAVGYVLCSFFTVRESFEERSEADVIECRTVAALFKFMNDQLFEGTPETRFTFFVPEHGGGNARLEPWVRYRVGVLDAARQAEESKVRYARGEGITGFAWEYPRDQIHVAVFPPFATRREMEDYYVQEMGISEANVKHISTYMEKVRTILTYGFVDQDDELLGVVSIDFLRSSEDLELDEERISEVVTLIQGVLQTFKSSERGTRVRR
jgi:hypothetical protein